MLDIKDPVEEAFTGDHRQTEQQFAQVKTLVDRAAWSDAVTLAKALARKLREHINVEDAWVYPPVERYAQQDEDLQRTLAILSKRHLEIPAYAEEIVAAAEDEDADEASAAIDLLVRVLADHHGTEEQDIFPLFKAGAPLEGDAAAAARALNAAHQAGGRS
ncbi:hemerythrin domain-containing protein [Acidihalobacter ferrooxydans]|uniref:Hemerythrin-like domain-containing protein n=1 Tax=Acidihalobacter ferrooxydans TaxID=1765967 RepID=A0A1P8UJL5_9GAMM|nr:hemerythrin domain-containing protein [Acidihalobacter ferrooxydans]APZ43991.1 hypothetical protein BW247_13570 [Acidihalobacter ferrooxydans]